MKYVFEIKSDVISTDGDFGFKSLPIVFNEEQGYCDCYGVSAFYNLNSRTKKPWVPNPPRFLGFVDLDPECPGHYFELAPFRLEIPINEDISDMHAFNMLREVAQFICWQLSCAIRGRYYNIDDYLEFFCKLVSDTFACGVKYDTSSWTETSVGLRETYKFTGNADGKIEISFTKEK